MKARTLYIFTLLMMNEAVSRQVQEREYRCRTEKKGKGSLPFSRTFGKPETKGTSLPSGEAGLYDCS